MDIFIISNSLNFYDLRRNPDFKIDLGKGLVVNKNNNPNYEIPEQINLYGHLTKRILHKEGSYKGLNVYSDYGLPTDQIIFMNDTDKWEGVIDSDIVSKIDSTILKINSEKI